MNPRFRTSLVAVLASATLAISIPTARAGEPAAPATNDVVVSHASGYLVLAATPGITTDLEATTERPVAGEIRFTSGGVLPIAPDGSGILHDFALAGSPALGAVRVETTNATIFSFINFLGSTGRRTGYEIPLLTHAIGSAPNLPSEVRLVTNPIDRSFGTSLVLFNVGDNAAWITATIYDIAHPNAPTREYILTRPHGEMTWYDIATRFEVGRIELMPGLVGAGIGCGECDRPSEVYGFAAIGTPNGDAPRVRPIIPKAAFSFWLP